MKGEIDWFYGILQDLEALPGQGRSLSDYTGKSGLPERGVYFFREPGEYRLGRADVQRIVRVGTHAVSANSRATLWGRLRAHRGTVDGRGNHRGSVFRRHVGTAMLRRNSDEIGRHPEWGVGSNASKDVRVSEVPLERKVSAYLSRMSVLWVSVPDAAGRESRRAYIERNSIGLLSNGMRPRDTPSEGWLGRYSPHREISESGLWNLNHVGDPVDPDFLDVLEDFVRAMVDEGERRSAAS